MTGIPSSTRAAPPVSVLCLTRNHRQFLLEAVTSVWTQDLDGVEIIIADDHSDDGSDELLADLATQKDVTVLLAETRLGIRMNGTRALAACRGEFVAILDGDDVWLPGKLATQLEWFEDNPAGVLCGHDVEVFDSDSGETLWLWSEHFRLRAGRGPRGILRNGPPCPAVSAMFRRSASPEYGYDPRLEMFVDWKL